MLKQFLLLLAGDLGIIALRYFCARRAVLRETGRRLRSACAMGLPSGLLEHFELTLESASREAFFGWAGFCAGQRGARNDRWRQKEFELLGGQVAVPILDRETVIGAAVFDGRVTGEPLVNAELELISICWSNWLGIKNIWLQRAVGQQPRNVAGICATEQRLRRGQPGLGHSPC